MYDRMTSTLRAVRNCAVLLLAGVAVALTSPQPAAAQNPSLAPLAFTAPQAAGGRVNYAGKCAICHGSELEGSAGPALANGGFDKWVSSPVSVLFDYLQTKMPLDSPGSMSADQTATIIAYMASRNGFKPGPQPLASDPAVLGKTSFRQ